jgi:cytochrome b
MLKKIRVWDLPTRLFHWAFAIVIIGALVTINLDETELHAKFGYAACVLVIFRIIWGFVGPEHARFTNFVPSLATVKAFIRNPIHNRLGHNPLGALSVIGVLAVVLVQTLTGLFADDDIAFEGPLHNAVSSQLASILTEMHEINSNLIYALVALHLVAIFYYQRIKKENLIGPMVLGDKEITDEQEKSLAQVVPSKDTWGVRIFALVILGIVAGGFYFLVLSK